MSAALRRPLPPVTPFGHGTGVDHESYPERAPTAPATREARCIACGCTDSRACHPPCSWLWVNRDEGVGLCSACDPDRQFGLPGKRWSATRSGAATLVPLGDRDVDALVAGEELLTYTYDGLRVVRVARIRTGVAGECGDEYEVPVVDARFDDGRCLTYAPGDLLRIALEVDP